MSLFAGIILLVVGLIMIVPAQMILPFPYGLGVVVMLVIAGIFLTAMLGIIAQPAFAEYNDLDKGLYQEMEKSKAKVEIATQIGAEGSGTPVFDADGVLGASILSGGIFGGSAAMVFIKGRNGKYAAMGRG